MGVVGRCGVGKSFLLSQFRRGEKLYAAPGAQQTCLFFAQGAGFLLTSHGPPNPSDSGQGADPTATGFPVGGEEHTRRGMPCTQGVDVVITSEHLVLLDARVSRESNLGAVVVPSFFLQCTDAGYSPASPNATHYPRFAHISRCYAKGSSTRNSSRQAQSRGSGQDAVQREPAPVGLTTQS